MYLQPGFDFSEAPSSDNAHTPASGCVARLTDSNQEAFNRKRIKSVANDLILGVSNKSMGLLSMKSRSCSVEIIWRFPWYDRNFIDTQSL